jgi:hypothetical protein
MSTVPEADVRLIQDKRSFRRCGADSLGRKAARKSSEREILYVKFRERRCESLRPSTNLETVSGLPQM